MRAQKSTPYRPLDFLRRLGKKGWGLVRIDVRAPCDLVFACLRDFRRYPEMISAIRSSEVLSPSGPEMRCSYRITRRDTV